MVGPGWTQVQIQTRKGKVLDEFIAKGITEGVRGALENRPTKIGGMVLPD